MCWSVGRTARTQRRQKKVPRRAERPGGHGAAPPGPE